MNLNILFAGFKYPIKVIQKYEKIYTDKSIIIPFTFRSLYLGSVEHSKYEELNNICKNYNNIHVHVMSGSCYLLYNFLKKYPENKLKIKSQIYDSPCHYDGMGNAFKEMYNISPCITNYISDKLFYDAKHVSEIFLKGPIVNCPTGIILSDNDNLSPIYHIDTMIKNWEPYLDLKILKTNSKHLKSFRDNPSEYRHFCNDVHFSKS